MDGTSIKSITPETPPTAAASSTLVYFPSDIAYDWYAFVGQEFYIEIIESDMDTGDLCTHEFRDDTWIFPNYSPPTPTPNLPYFSSTSQAYYSTCCHSNQSNQDNQSNRDVTYSASFTFGSAFALGVRYSMAMIQLPWVIWREIISMHLVMMLRQLMIQPGTLVLLTILSKKIYQLQP